MSEKTLNFHGKPVQCITSELFHRDSPLYKVFIKLDPESKNIDFEYSCWFDKEKEHSAGLEDQAIAEAMFGLERTMYGIENE